MTVHVLRGKFEIIVDSMKLNDTFLLIDNRKFSSYFAATGLPNGAWAY